MNLRSQQLKQRASALIIVLWIGFGLVTLALYFGQSMSYELQAADNASAALEADQAIQGSELPPRPRHLPPVTSLVVHPSISRPFRQSPITNVQFIQ